MSFTLTFVVGTVGSIAAIAAAFFWLWASRIRVPNDIDNFIGVLQRVSKLNAYGALAASVAALCGLLVLWFGRQVSHLL